MKDLHNQMQQYMVLDWILFWKEKKKLYSSLIGPLIRSEEKQQIKVYMVKFFEFDNYTMIM